MSFFDIFILSALGAALFLAVRFMGKNRNRGCSGCSGCGGCDGNCRRCKDKDMGGKDDGRL